MIRNLFIVLIVGLAIPLFSQEMSNPFLQLTPDGKLQLTTSGASHFARLALNCIQKEYPNKLNQVLQDESELKPPHELHPAFYGCFDWHSSVHGHWMLVRLLKLFPDMPESDLIRKRLNENLTKENIAGEVAYFKTASKSFERMYGWSWLMKLSDELYNWEDKDGKKWLKTLKPMTEEIIQRYIQFLPIQDYPVRTGVHPNTAFGLSFAWDYAESSSHAALKGMIEQRARDYYLEDKDCPSGWEPSGEDFLSACLEEANLMSRVLPRDEFNKWFRRFLPKKKLQKLTDPADVSDRSDPKIVHLDGLNLSRAWCMYQISAKIKSVNTRVTMTKSANHHLNLTIPNIASKHYEGSHWLASFAVFALSFEN